MTRKNVAIVLSGGTSLGSYIAGALDELMKAFATAPDRFQVDIITGASAGATTAALLAHGLLYGGGAMPLHDVWVDGIDIVDLLAPTLDPDNPPSILDSRPLRALARQALQAPLSGAGRAPFAAARLTVAMTLGNVSALPYISRVLQPAANAPEAFVQHRNAEQETFWLDGAIRPEDPLWTRIADVARASAAIPFVFPLVQLAREAHNPRHYLQPPAFSGTGQFWYYDGGTFNNLPLGLAWHYAQQQGTLDDRLVVVINPWRAAPESPDLHPAHPGPLVHAFGLLSAMQNEATAVQFEHEVLDASRAQAAEVPSLGIPGVDPPPVELLGRFALVMPRAEEGRLRGNHLHALAAFLDHRFREYDFRRGAADAQRVIETVLGLRYEAGRPAGYYQPDADPALRADLTTYEGLDAIPSSRHPGQSVRQVFEAALDTRLDRLIGAWNPPGPNVISDLALRHSLHPQLAKLWPL